MTTDFASFLGLKKILTEEEIDDLTAQISQEVWYRILNEEMPALLGVEKYAAFRLKADLYTDLSKVLQALDEIDPKLDFLSLVEKVSCEVKNEYITAFKKDVISMDA